MYWSLCKDPLQLIIHLRRNKADRGALDLLPAVVQNIDRQARTYLAGALRRNVDICFEIAIFIDRCQQSGGRNIISQMDWDIAHNSVEGCTDAVICQLF